MLAGSIQISGETLSSAEVKDICESLRAHSVRLLSLRGCHLSDRDFGRISRHVAECQSLAQLNLNLGVVSTLARVQQLAEALVANRSIHSLFLHGSPLTDSGLAVLNPALSLHPSLISLDLGDCVLGDEAINLICGLLPPDGAKSGDHIAGMLAVAVASSRTLEVVDLEGTGLTNQSAQIFLDMVQNYPTSMRSLILAENNISLELQQQISDLLSEGEEEEDNDNEDQEDSEREKDIWINQSIQPKWSHLLYENRKCWEYSTDSTICSLFYLHILKSLGKEDVERRFPYQASPTILMSTGLEDSLLAETEM
ncbi:leucine-rich repeat-containing protein 73 isoform X4 [Hypanus sabinus]|uniref:leucine-rich repeat-containing protein 73 isoform X4 n=1 Tax=Hypanus sabinus TaxID=79690 RepID=UPI0028C50A21|nr:leucine-rich repeat-containing protein 73 isoform X4 [Hypanus sabinus]